MNCHKFRYSEAELEQYNSADVQQCRKKNYFNSTENENFVQQCRKYEQISTY